MNCYQCNKSSPDTDVTADGPDGKLITFCKKCEKENEAQWEADAQQYRNSIDSALGYI